MESSGNRGLSGKRSLRTPVVIGAVVALSALAVFGRSFWRDTAAADAKDEPQTIHAVEVRVQDLVATKTARGELDFGAARMITAPVEGTVTSIAESDQRLQRGETIFAIDAVPSVVVFGDTPMYRRLEIGVSDGHDVQVAETNLAALGFGTKHDLLVDNHYDRATERAVRDFEASVGAPIDGRLDPIQMTVLTGPAVVDSTAVQLGAQLQSGSPILEVTATEVVTAIAFTRDGLVTGLPTVGAKLNAGDVAYQIDGVRFAVLLGPFPPARTLSRDRPGGPDVLQLENNLDQLGIKDAGQLLVDGSFDVHTEAAWRNWERWFGHPVDGKASVEDYVVVPVNAEVSSVAAPDGIAVGRGQLAFELSQSNRVVTAKIDAADDKILHIGDPVTIEFPDATTMDGTITGIDSSTTTDETDGSITTGFKVAVSDIPEQFAERYRVEVKVKVVSEVATGEVVIPASALISTGNGTYAVEVVVDGTSTKYVSVTPGLFTDGNVAVSGIDAGTAVVVPES